MAEISTKPTLPVGLRDIVRGRFHRHPRALACACGSPLELAQLTDDNWALGHFSCMQSEVVYGATIGEVMLSAIGEG